MAAACSSLVSGLGRRLAPGSAVLVDPGATPAPDGPPPRSDAIRELRAVGQMARLCAAAPWLARAPRGDGTVVVDLPGWRAPEGSNIAMRTWLRRLGWDARAWGLGTNRGTPERDAEILAERLRAQPADDPPVALVGWSLGGTIAREVAREVPERVRAVITYGSPVVGGPTHTLGARAFGAEECARVDALIRELDAAAPIPVPITAVFTRRDAVVDWRACIDRTSPRVEHREVRSTHLGLGLDPDVWWTVATALAGQPQRAGASVVEKVGASASTV